MPLKKFICLLLAAAFCITKTFAQDDGCNLRISLLTCTPGEELYSTFGHTAIRVVDTMRHSDWVFNYGTFDFDDPDFYMKFVRGKLDYSLSVEKFSDFIYAYQLEQRSVWEQTLDISCEQRQLIWHAIEMNLQGNNRFYKYNFLLDNCTTRVRDILLTNIATLSIPKALIPAGTTSRDLIHSYLDKGGEPWSKLGIDLLLGSRIDKPVTNNQAMFLPDYLMKGVDSAVTATDPSIVGVKHIILENAAPYTQSGKYVPLIVFAVISLVFAVLYLVQFKGASNVRKIIDCLLLYLTGLLGILILFMWFGTDHTDCRNNYNLIWALPTNFVAALFIWRRPAWLRVYFYIAFFIYGLLFISWFWLPQEFNISVVPILLLLLFRYAALSNRSVE